MLTEAITVVSLVFASLAGGFLFGRFGRRGRRGGDGAGSGKGKVERIVSASITERVRAVGRLVGLEVSAKEIATSTVGLSWLPPMVLSHAKVAMIFRFQRTYSVDLSRMSVGDVEFDEPGKRARVRLPGLTSAVQLSDVTPYDIQSGRLLGLLDVIPMTAARQGQLMEHAREQAAGLFTSHDSDYAARARASVERHLAELLRLFGVEAEFSWPEVVEAGERGENRGAAASGTESGAAQSESRAAPVARIAGEMMGEARRLVSPVTSVA